VSEKRNKVEILIESRFRKCIQFLLRVTSLLYVLSLSVILLYDHLALMAGRSGMRCPLVYRYMVIPISMGR